MTPSWASEAVFYHIYPLGLCAAPSRNDFRSQPSPRLEKLYAWLDHIQELGATALYLGPLFESSAHGYDTADYYRVDRRLGDQDTLAAFARELHRRGLRLVLDGVFNHVGRDFWAFRDLQAHGCASAYVDWFQGLDFSRRSPYGDPFGYEGWAGHYDLVKLNLAHPDLRAHLFDAVKLWTEAVEIDGLRLDAADQIAPDFLSALAGHARSLSPDFWLMGEVVFDDYRCLAAPDRLDSATNYEVYKALYSSHVDGNYFELAYALNRQSGPEGIYRGLHLYNFADNHDVDRVASRLTNPAHLYPLYVLLFTIPGIPSVYYGSEWGLSGKRSPHSDVELRPSLELDRAAGFPHPDLLPVIAGLSRLRRISPALTYGDYRSLHVASQQLAFLRSHPQQCLVVVANASSSPTCLDLRLPQRTGRLVDLLNPGAEFAFTSHQARLDIPPTWARVLELR